MQLKPNQLPKTDGNLGPYGLMRVDYTKIPPLITLPPPPPARTNPVRRYLPFVLAASAVAGGVWIYFNQDEEVYEYWSQVEQGNVPFDFGEGQNGDEEDDDEEFDVDEDEWEEEDDKTKR